MEDPDRWSFGQSSFNDRLNDLVLSVSVFVTAELEAFLACKKK